MKKLILTFAALAVGTSNASAIFFSGLFTFHPFVKSDGSFFSEGSLVEVGTTDGVGSFSSLESVFPGQGFTTATADIGTAAGESTFFVATPVSLDTIGTGIEGMQLAVRITDGSDIIQATTTDWIIPSGPGGSTDFETFFFNDTDLTSNDGVSPGPDNLLPNVSFAGSSDDVFLSAFGENGAGSFQLVGEIPEPSTYAATFGGLALGLAVMRRRLLK